MIVMCDICRFMIGYFYGTWNIEYRINGEICETGKLIVVVMNMVIVIVIVIVCNIQHVLYFTNHISYIMIYPLRHQFYSWNA